MMSQALKNEFKALCDDELEVIEELCNQLRLWAIYNKAKLTVKIIDLYADFGDNNGSNIYIAHNMFDEVMVEYSSKFVKSIVEVLDQYCDTDFHKRVVDGYWLPTIKSLNEKY